MESEGTGPLEGVSEGVIWREAIRFGNCLCAGSGLSAGNTVTRYHRRLWGGRRWNAVPTKRTLRNAVVAGGRLKRRQDGGFPS